MGETETGRPSRRLVAVGAAVVGLMALGALAPRDPNFDAFFGIEAYRHVGGLAALLPAAALLALLAWPGVAAAVARALARTAGRIPWSRTALVAGTSLAFLLLTDRRLSGDGGSIVTMAAARYVYPSNALTSYLHQILQLVPGVTPDLAVRFLSVLAGGVYASTALGLGRELFEDGPRRAALVALLLTAGPAALFFGSIEVYAAPFAAIAVYLLVGLRFLRGKEPWWIPPLALGVAFTLHGSAGLLLPSLLWLVHRGRAAPTAPRRWLATGGVFLVPVFVVGAVLFLFTWQGQPPSQAAFRTGSFAGALGQGPLLPLVRTDATLLHRYVLLDLEHTLGVLNLWLLAALPGLALLVAGRLRGAGERGEVGFVVLAAVFVAAFPVFWNVSYPLRRDWDLFSSVGIPVTLLGGWAFLRTTDSPGNAVRAAALGLFVFAPFVLGNALDREQKIRHARSMAEALETGRKLVEDPARKEELLAAARNRRRVVAALDPTIDDFDEATRLATLGEFPRARELYERVLAARPEHVRARRDLGVVLWQTGHEEEAREQFRRAIRDDPSFFPARLDLARSYVQEQRYDEAVPLLEAAVRHGGVDLRATDGLRLLAGVLKLRGDAERASRVLRLADERDEVRGRRRETEGG